LQAQVQALLVVQDREAVPKIGTSTEVAKPQIFDGS